ncbi:MAG TPA: hypothetical protein VMF35_01705 [Acidimicrobiales bacterium]|nr:hypothetical protein [Acidimicrobiales bacterium]
MLRRTLPVTALAAFAGVWGVVSTAAATPAVSRPLAVSDLPPGFKEQGVPLLSAPCSEIFLPKDAPHHVVVGFSSPAMVIEEALTSTAGARAVYGELASRYSGCRSIPLTKSNGSRLSGTGTRLASPSVGDQSRAFLFHLVVNGYTVNDEVVIFRKGQTCGVVTFISEDALSQPSVELVSALAASKVSVSSS